MEKFILKNNDTSKYLPFVSIDFEEGIILFAGEVYDYLGDIVLLNIM